ncbi:MAG: hypothetical protein LAO20_16530 [Acidobacteriia bacterium]|nr:hypothetical protein [Terriglobia bacterium]
MAKVAGTPGARFALSFLVLVILLVILLVIAARHWEKRPATPLEHRGAVISQYSVS